MKASPKTIQEVWFAQFCGVRDGLDSHDPSFVKSIVLSQKSTLSQPGVKQKITWYLGFGKWYNVRLLSQGLSKNHLMQKFKMFNISNQ